MCSVATSSSLASDFVFESAAVSSESFFKDGRKISIGDCALFKPPQDSPAFIGIVRRLISEEEQNLRLSVNWLYRPADVKLGKGALVEAAPNEVFYSFHKDEILAASLLHPCKVAFLRKGVELPSNISSFVCRRVYDVENKCLWWLTDQDYINERQEEVDQLLQKTQNNMYGSVQSPKSLNGMAGNNQQQRSNSENTKNINSHLPSQIKIKKRERVEQSCSDSVKRECLSLHRADDTDLGHTLKLEINKISNCGGLVDYEGVEKFVQLMQNGSLEKKLDWPCKTMLIDVLAVTDKFDCLGFFVQLKGLPVLDEWIQEIHKGKINDGNNNIAKESDKAIDDFLLSLLHALDKLPVNLHALQTCNIGKSVNQLRAHKNVEIQKKARSLVDTWKKRVEAEMNVLDTKSGSSHGNSWQGSPKGNRRSGGQPEVSGKVSNAQSGKLPCAKLGAGEIVAKVIATSPNSLKPMANNTKDPIPVTGSDPLSSIKEEKCSSSSHSHNNSQSCSSDHSHKISVSGSRHRKSSYNFQGSVLAGAQKETISGKSSLNKNTGSEKICDGNNQRLIVRLPNTGRSPARSSTGGPYENSPSAKSAKSDQRDRKLLEKNDTLRYNTISKGDREDKNLILRSDEDKAFSNDKKQCEEREKVTESSSGYKAREGNLYDASFKSMNALVESCVKFSEASVSASGGDDIGMNLLASVAAGELSRSGGSDSVSSERNLAVPEESCSGNDVNSKHRDEDTARSEDKANPVDLLVKDESSHDARRSLANFSADNKVGISSLDAITDHNVKVEGVGEFHDQRITDGDTSGNCKKEQNMAESALKLAEVGIKAESVLKEDKRDSPSLSSTEMYPEKKCVALNEQKLIDNSVCVVKPESEQEKTTDTHAVSQIVEREKQSDNIPSTIADQSADLVEKSDGKALGNFPGKSFTVEPTTASVHQAEVKMNGEKDVVKLDFDLNEGFNIDDNYEEPIVKSPVRDNKPPLPISSLSVSFPASVTVASAVKGPFYPSENSFRGKGELGWKGSAATSAFRPAEPRKTQGRPQLDFDLNVTDERDLEGESHGSGFDLDLNRIDECHNKAPKIGLFNKPSLSELNSSRDFDLNSGPGADDVPLERETRVKSNVPFLSPIAGVRMTGTDQASLSSWFPQANSYPPVAITPILQNREHGYPVSGSQRIMGHPGGITSLVPEFYRGPVLSSSPAIPFPNNVPFQYPFPFETNFSMPTHSYPTTSTAYSSIPSSQYPRAYMMNIPGGGVNTVGSDSRRWVGQGLDLNTGPGSVERERGDERVSSSLRHVPIVPGSQTFSADEQMRMYQMAGGSLKRKEPDGGTNYKQLPPWQ